MTLPQQLAAHCMGGSEQKAQLHPQVPYGARKAHAYLVPTSPPCKIIAIKNASKMEAQQIPF